MSVTIAFECEIISMEVASDFDDVIEVVVAVVRPASFESPPRRILVIASAPGFAMQAGHFAQH